MQRLWVKVSLAAMAVIVLVMVLIPFLVNADTLRPAVENQLSSSLGRKVALGHLGFSLFGGSLNAENISIADDPAFGTSPFIGAKSLKIGVEIGPLFFHRQVRITRLTIDSPAIQLIEGQNGRWNFSSLGGAASNQAGQNQGALPDLTVGELKIANGSATVSSLPAKGKPFVYTGISLDVKQLSFLKSFPFQLSAKLPGDGSLDLNGTAGPVAQKNAADTPFQANLQLKHLDPVAAGVVDAGAGISMVLDIDAQLASNGSQLTSEGKIEAAKLQLARNGSPAPQPVEIEYNVAQDLETRAGQVSDIAVHTGAVAVHVTGGYQMTPQGMVLDLHLSAPNLPIDQVEQLLPAAGVKVPSGSSLHGGTLTANLAISGPATAVTLAGPVEIDKTQLAGFDLGSRIEGLNPFGSKGGGTSIQTLRTTVSSTPQSTQLSNIYADIPLLGTATGKGTVAASGALNISLAAKLSALSGVGAVASQAQNAVGSVLGGLGRFKPKVPARTNSGIPLTITGTETDPKIHADVKAMFK